jgi:hypothetical protein
MDGARATGRQARNPLLSLIVAAFLVVGCEKTPAPAEAVKAGADVDAKGCKASAGYTWSEMKQQCIRIWEESVAFEPVDTTDPDQWAFVVFSDDKPLAELYWGDQRAVLDVQPAEEGDISPVVMKNESKGIEVLRTKDVFVLRINGKAAYTHEPDAEGQMVVGRKAEE